VPPRVRDTLTRATAGAGHAYAWISDEGGQKTEGRGRDALTHRLLTRSPDRNRGRVANPTTLLTRFAEELRRAPAAGGAGTE